jgi:hypothetical protein
LRSEQVLLQRMMIALPLVIIFALASWTPLALPRLPVVE